MSRLLQLRSRASLARAGIALMALLSLPATAATPATSCQPQITDARYSAPTTRYAHGVLGDAIEYGALEVSFTLRGECKSDTTSAAITLPDSLVFEDIAPRLWDVDGDTLPEVVAVESSLTEGARLTVWTLADGELTRLASTPHIGQAYRWLAPIGAADLDGDGAIEIAYIDRPHLAKLLRVWRYSDGELQLVAEGRGLTNHRIGDRMISSDLRVCEGKPTLITANSNWTQIIGTTLDADGLASRALGPLRTPEGVFDTSVCGG